VVFREDLDLDPRLPSIFRLFRMAPRQASGIGRSGDGQSIEFRFQWDICRILSED